MTTVFGALVGGFSLVGSKWETPLEDAAPGITAIIAANREYTTNWWVTAQGLLPVLEMLPEQRDLVFGIIAAAREEYRLSKATVGGRDIGESTQVNAPQAVQAAQASSVNQSLIAQNAVAPKADLLKVISYVGAGVTVLRWITA